MSEKRKAAPGAGTPKSGGEKGYWQAPENPQHHLTTSKERAQGFIEGFLSRGSENAVPLRQLVVWTDLNERQVRKLIEMERRSGCTILSDSRSGYFLADSQEEALAFVRSMLHRSGEIAKTARAIERTVLRQAEGQTQILE